MQLRAIELRLAGARHRSTEFFHDPVDVGDRQHVDRLAPAGFRHLHEVNDLRNNLRVRRIVNASRQSRQTGNELIVADAQERAGLGLVDRHRLDDDQAGATMRVSDVAVGDVPVDEAIFAGQPRHHCRHHDAVREQHSADVQGFE